MRVRAGEYRLTEDRGGCPARTGRPTTEIYEAEEPNVFRGGVTCYERASGAARRRWEGNEMQKA